MATAVIEKGVPVPKTRRTPDRWTKQFPIDSLKVGESIFVTGMSRQAVSVHCSRLGLSYEPRKVFQTSQREENGVAGIRVWRME